MLNQYDIVTRLTSEALSDVARHRMLNDFAYELGWRPSDRLEGLTVVDFANAHLVVEHGLENTAVITFLRGPRRFSDLGHAEKRRLLTISYNNLVDWHIQVDTDEVTFVFNRTDPPSDVERHHISRDNVDTLRSEAFERIAGKRPNPNLPALDDALIETISFWKRSLSAEMGYSVPNESLSALFNAIIFVRAAEDQHRRFCSLGGAQAQPYSSQALLEAWEDPNAPSLTPREMILQNLERFIEGEIPEDLINKALLSIFDSLDRQTVLALLRDFYRNKYAPYEYDFSLMSKHALSRIYEHYVSILRLEESPQLTLPLFPHLPEEERDKTYGSIYTPQFIARFFARYLREQMPPIVFKRIQAADPACGSGIFLRTLLELQCDPTQDGVTTEHIKAAFENVLGIDVNESACQAARLSLALLHLVLTNQLPQALNVLSAESIKYYQEHPELKGTYDAVIANPPFISLDTQTPAMRERVSQFMGKYASGRIDMYLAFLRIGLEMLKPGGYGLFVLPHSFLLSENAREMRQLLSQTSWIRCLADLSAIRVFQDSGSYIVLLIFQKLDTGQKAPPAMIIKCQDMVGRALQDAIEGRPIETTFYSIYDVDQDTFAARFRLTERSLHELEAKVPSLAIFTRLRALEDKEYPTEDSFLKALEETLGKDLYHQLKSLVLEHATFENEWLVLPPTESAIRRKFEALPTIDDFLYVREGFVSGADDVFIVSAKQIPAGEEEIFVPYLHDREMKLYAVPNETSRYFFYPYLDGCMVEEGELKERFPKTWDYLQSYRRKLESRAPVRRGQLDWWRPVRPRPPKRMMRPKIISPHLVLIPRFSLDREGKYAISRSPLLYPKETGAEDDLLRFFVAVLNSTPGYWYIATHSHVYRGGYVMLEPKTLRRIPVPDPTEISPATKRRLLALVDERLLLSGPATLDVEKRIDKLVADLYGLSSQERQALGIED